MTEGSYKLIYIQQMLGRWGVGGNGTYLGKITQYYREL